MKSFIYLVPALVLAQFAFGQDNYSAVTGLSDEEIDLVRAFRNNPEPFRQLMQRQERSGHGSYSPREGGELRQNSGPVVRGDAVVGPRDVIDVSIEGGSVAFYGKNYAYEPVSFRIARGETIDVIFRKAGAITENKVVVSYRGDGLHFDVPEAWGGTTSPERGLLVIREDGRWSSGEVILQEGKITSSRTLSKADHLSFRIRYAGSRR